MQELNEIILYQPDETVKLEVRIEDETVWLTQTQLVELFQSSKANISEHIKHIYQQQELEEAATVRKFRTVQNEGGRQIMRSRTFYNLDVIISVGYRVNTRRGIEFRQWANKVLKEYMMRGYAFSNRMERLEQRVTKAEEKIDFFVRTSLPPVEGVFYNGQIFDAYLFASVRNEALRWLSKNRRDGQVPIEELIGNEPEDGDSPLELLESEELRDVLSQAIDSLPERCRIIFLLAREEGVKPKEIAEMLSIKESTVRVQMKLAVDRLIAYLRPIFPNMSFSWFLPFLF